MPINASVTTPQRYSLSYNRAQPTNYSPVNQQPRFQPQQQQFFPIQFQTNPLHAGSNGRNRVQSSRNKQNKWRGSRDADYYSKTSDEVVRLIHENQCLKQQMARQKELHSQKVSKLLKNIKQKDELLDECEQQINNLRINYQKLLQQKSQSQGVSRNNSIRNIETKTANHETLTRSSGLHNSVIPLSIISKEGILHKTDIHTAKSEKMLHGLMRK